MASNDASTVHTLIPNSTSQLVDIVRASYPDSLNIHTVTLPASSGGFSYASPLSSFGGFSDLYTRYLFVQVERIEVVVEAFSSDCSCVFGMSRSTDIPSQPKREDLLSCLSHGSIRYGTNGSAAHKFVVEFTEGLSKQLKPLPVDAFEPTLGFYIQAVAPADMCVIVRFYYKHAGPIISKASVSASGVSKASTSK